jgi:hypothetical protein
VRNVTSYLTRIDSVKISGMMTSTTIITLCTPTLAQKARVRDPPGSRDLKISPGEISAALVRGVLLFECAIMHPRVHGGYQLRIEDGKFNEQKYLAVAMGSAVSGIRIPTIPKNGFS